MSQLIIEGGIPLKGKIKVSGNKNAALPMIAACLLTDKAITLHNLPDILDVKHMLEALQSLGVSVDRHADSVTIHAKDLTKSSLDHKTCSKIRTSILLVAPILYRTGKAEIYPQEGKVILLDSPVVTDPQGSLAGYRITLLQGEQKVLVEKGPGQRPKITLPEIPDLGIDGKKKTKPISP